MEVNLDYLHPKGHWRASSGDYGLSDCYGTLKNDKNDDVQFEVFAI